MIDANKNVEINNNCDRGDHSEKLETWLRDHTDPNKNPWFTDDWKKCEEILKVCNHSKDCHEKKVCVDPTIDRFIKIFLTILFYSRAQTLVIC